MEMTPERLANVSLNQQLVTAAVLRAVASTPKPFTDVAEIDLAVASTLDGILGAAAWLIVSSGRFPTPRDRRQLADRCRDAIVKFAKAAERDLDAGEDWEAGPSGAAN